MRYVLRLSSVWDRNLCVRKSSTGKDTTSSHIHQRLSGRYRLSADISRHPIFPLQRRRFLFHRDETKFLSRRNKIFFVRVCFCFNDCLSGYLYHSDDKNQDLWEGVTRKVQNYEKTEFIENCPLQVLFRKTYRS